MSNKTIAASLLAAQMEMGNAKKESENPYFKSKYADLNAIREVAIPTLNKHGIVVLQPTIHMDGKNFVKTLLLHESGESLESFTEIIFSKSNDAQAQGSGITYARRYGLQSLLNIGAEDDDGNGASSPQGNTTQPPTPQQPAPQQQAPEKPYLNILNKDGNPLEPKHAEVKAYFETGGSLEKIKDKYRLSKATEDYITKTFLNNGK